MKKRGISPLIATVLIIGFTIVLAAVVIQWGGSLVNKLKQDSEFKAQKQMIASELKFDVKKADFFINKAIINVDNSGSRNINGLKIRITGNKSTDVIDSNISLNAFEAKSIAVIFNKTKTGSVNEIEVFPVVNFENNSIVFSDISSKYEFDKNASSNILIREDLNYAPATGTNPVFVQGITNKALKFDGINDFVLTNFYNDIYKETGVTFEAWVNQTQNIENDTTIISRGGSNWSPYPQVYMETYDKRLFCRTGALKFGSFNNYAALLTTNNYIFKNKFIYVACTFYYNKTEDKTYIKAYVNGTLVSSTDITRYLNQSVEYGYAIDNQTNRPILIGAYAGNNYPNNPPINYFNGTIDSPAVYDRVLTDEEIKNHYDTTKPL